MTVNDMSDYSEDEYDSDDVLDSDEELQKAFSQGKLQVGTYKDVTPKDRLINDKSGMRTSIASFEKTGLDWVERLALTVEPAPPLPGTAEISENDKVHDDFKRELYFYRLAQNVVLQGIPKLHKAGIPTRRPDDYFAQMVKSDVHMNKIREVLLSKSVAAERSEKAKKIRELKKMGKKVQIEVLKSRQQKKKEALEAVKKYRKGQQDRLDFMEGDMQSMPTGKANDKSQKKQKGQKPKEEMRVNKRREWKNKKFGFGGQKKRSKSNDKHSVDNIDEKAFLRTRHGKPTTRRKATKSVRPGKSRRQQMKSKRR